LKKKERDTQKTVAPETREVGKKASRKGELKGVGMEGGGTSPKKKTGVNRNRGIPERQSLRNSGYWGRGRGVDQKKKGGRTSKKGKRGGTKPE